MACLSVAIALLAAFQAAELAEAPGVGSAEPSCEALCPSLAGRCAGLDATGRDVGPARPALAQATNDAAQPAAQGEAAPSPIAADAPSQSTGRTPGSQPEQHRPPAPQEAADTPAAAQPKVTTADSAAAEAARPGGDEGDSGPGQDEAGQAPHRQIERPTEQAGQQQLSADRMQVSADKIFLTDKVLAAEGNVTVRTDQYVITADVVEVDRVSEVAVFRGNVVIEGNHQRTKGKTLRIDLDSGWWRMEEADTRVDPEFFTARVLEPLYGKAVETEYDPVRGVIILRQAQLTSCEYWRHWEIRSPETLVRPDDWLKIRRPRLYAFGHRLIKYPFTLHLSLRERKQKIIPEVGNNEVEGYFLKLAFLYLMSSHNNGVLRLHFTQKRGIGFGFDHLLQDHRQTLDLSMFNEPSKGALSLRAHHSYRFSTTLTSDLSSNFQRHSGYLYTSSTLTSDLTFRNTDADSDTTAGFQHALATSGLGTTRRVGSTLYHSQRLGRRTSWNIRNTYTGSRYATQSVADEELNTRFEFRHQAQSYDLQAQFDKRYDIDGSRYQADAGYYYLDRIPAIAVTTDTRRLGGWRALGRAYTRLRAELGMFAQSPGGERVGRAAIIADLGGRQHPVGPDTDVRTGLRFRQSWFDEGSAQYFIDFNGDVRHRIDGHWAGRLSYDYSATRGFAPLRLDYGGRANELRLQMVRLVPDRSRVELSTGFDFIADAYRDLRILAELRSSERSYWRLQTAYSIERSRWWPLVLRYTTARRGLYLDLSTRYDVDQSRLATVTADADWRIGRWWRVEFVGSYSGWTRQLDQAQVRITRDLHCLVAQLTYSKWPRELSFAIGIKAFPAPTRSLGIGATGAYLPSLPGQYY